MSVVLAHSAISETFLNSKQFQKMILQLALCLLTLTMGRFCLSFAVVFMLKLRPLVSLSGSVLVLVSHWLVCDCVFCLVDLGVVTINLSKELEVLRLEEGPGGRPGLLGLTVLAVVKKFSAVFGLEYSSPRNS